MGNSDSFIFYRSFIDAIAEMDKNDQLAMFWAICEYALDDTYPQLQTGITRAVFNAIKPNIVANKERRKGGSNGGRPKKTSLQTDETIGFESENLGSQGCETEKPEVSEKKTIGFQEKNHRFSKSKPNVNVNVNEDVNEDEDVNVNADADEDTHRGAPAPSVSPAQKRKAAFTPPTLEEVAAYCRERGGKVDPQTWIDFYTANGWKVGKNPMRDWKASVRTWERNEDFASKRTGKKPILPQSADAQRSDIEWLQAFMAKHGSEFGGDTP